MMKTLLLIGSARSHSTSAVLGKRLLELLRAQGVETQAFYVHRVSTRPERLAEFLAASDEADIFILSSPLYVDCLPALVIQTLERLAVHRQDGGGKAGQRMLALMNCGFPEAQHNETALAICRRFAAEAGFEWLGGLNLGGGAFINGKPLDKVGKIAKNVVRSLELTAQALGENKPLPAEAFELMSKLPMPAAVYTRVGDMQWKRAARKYGTAKRLYERPYEK